MGYMMSSAMNSNDRAMWAYHHRDQMDDARYQQLLASDANLRAEVERLKAQNVPVNHDYVPTQMKDNPDLMFSKEAIEGQEVAYHHSEPMYEGPASSEWSGVGLFFAYVFWIFITCTILYGLYHILFVVKW